MTAHTPGPWLIWTEPCPDKDTAKRELSLLVDGTEPFTPSLPMVTGLEGTCVATTGCGPTSAANARLIAAAPELLEALVAICDELEAGDDTDAALIAKHAGRAAIAKATGKD